MVTAWPSFTQSAASARPTSPLPPRIRIRTAASHVNAPPEARLFPAGEDLADRRLEVEPSTGLHPCPNVVGAEAESRAPVVQSHLDVVLNVGGGRWMVLCQPEQRQAPILLG